MRHRRANNLSALGINTITCKVSVSGSRRLRLRALGVVHQIGGVPEHFLQFVAHKISRPQSLANCFIAGCAGVVQQFERALLAAVTTTARLLPSPAR